MVTTTADTSAPPAGEAYYYLVTAVNAGDDGAVEAVVSAHRLKVDGNTALPDLDEAGFL